MSKLTIDDKIKIIQLYKEGYTSRIIAKEIKVCHSRVSEIISKYNLYGETVLEVTHKKRKYTIEFKIDFVRATAMKTENKTTIKMLISKRNRTYD